MAGCGGEARSVALETAYVHEVYEEISGAHQHQAAQPQGAQGAQGGQGGQGGSWGGPGPSRAWPKVAQFLHDLEPGALVCDVGCGNGKYLSINPTVFQIGGDRCQSLTEAAREKEHEVLVCDNLALPFRDECFDAVLSVAVVHHLATTERRVTALRELARVLRIGGRLIITVWAMEQRHRKFESQDVLVPWHRPQHLSTPSLELTSTTTTTTTSEEDLHPPYHAYTQTSDSDSCPSNRLPGHRRRGRTRHKGRSIDHSRPLSESHSSSSLSSPNETCYSFVRRALQRLAGGKRAAPWFLDTWSSASNKEPPRRHEPEGCEDASDIQDLPIELRRLEEESEPPQRRQTLTCASSSPQDMAPLGLKSKSLSDILTSDARAMTRSRSSVPSLSPGAPVAPQGPVCSSGGSSASLRSVSVSSMKPRLVKQKQSMCEEEAEEEEEEAGGDQPTDMRTQVSALPDLPDFKRLHGGGGCGARAAARAGRLNVLKQSSMNEELMSAERLREKERVRQNIQKQASLNEELMYRRATGPAAGTLDSLRDTLFSTSTAKRFQLLKIGLTSKLKSSTTGIEKVAGTSFKNGFVRMLQGWKQGVEVPNVDNRTPPPTRQQSCNTPSDMMTPSTPPPDGAGPKRHSTGSINGMDEARARRPSREDGSDSSKDSSLQSDTSVDSEDSIASVIYVPKADQFLAQDPKTPSPTCSGSTPASPQPTSPKVLLGPSSPLLKHCSSPSPPQLPSSPRLLVEDVVAVPVIPVLPSATFMAAAKDRVTHEGRLQQIKELLRQRNMAGRGMFPLVRRSSGSFPRPAQTRAPPRLLSLELFNPETDDVDSDSSGVSSPDSVDSVISVAAGVVSAGVDEAVLSVSRSSSPTAMTSQSAEHLEAPPAPPPRSRSVSPATIPTNVGAVSSGKEADPGPSHSSSTPASLTLLEAAADVASSLEDAVEAVIQSSPRARRRQINLESADPRVALQDACSRSSWSLQSPESPPPPRGSKLTPSVSRFSLPGSLGAVSKHDTVFKFPQTNSLSKVDSLRSGRRAGSTGRIQDGLGRGVIDYSSLGAIPKNFDPDAFRVGSMYNHSEQDAVSCKPREVELNVVSVTKTTDADPFTLGAIPESDPFVTEGVASTAVLGDAWIPVPNPGRTVPPLVLSPREGQVADGSAAAVPAREEDCWDENVRQHLADFAEQLSERLLEEIERYREETSSPLKEQHLARLNEELQGLSKLTAELQERRIGQGQGQSTRPTDKAVASLAKNVDSSSELLWDMRSAGTTTRRALDSSLPSLDSSEGLTGVSSLSSSIRSTDGDSAPHSEASDVEVVVPCAALGQSARGTDSPADAEGEVLRHGVVAQLRSGCSVESSDGGDFSERTGSGTDCSRADSRRDTSSAGKTASSASLGTMESSDAYDAASDCSRDARFADRRTARCDGRSSSEEAPPRAAQLVRQKAAVQEPPEGVTKTVSCTTSLSGSTSQDSLPSDSGGGAITFHRYYHVFREGELDQLIERYVENLHIISSYYDHTNWCVVAEKVQVWTI